MNKKKKENPIAGGDGGTYFGKKEKSSRKG